MPRRETELGIAQGLCSADAAERARATGAFVRRFTCSAPTELALVASCFADVCASYRGNGPLAEHLLQHLPIPEELSLAWRLALLEGEGLSSALQAFHERYRRRLSTWLRRYCRDPDDVTQHVLLQILRKRSFRRAFFGKYAGEGTLTCYMRTVFRREAARLSRYQGQSRPSMPLLDGLQQHREPLPGRSAIRRELRTHLTEALQDVSRDPGFVPFLLQQGFDMRPTDIACILGLSENAVRQRIFRVRGRLRRVWRRLHPHKVCPLCVDERPTG